MDTLHHRRDFLKLGGAGGLALTTGGAWARCQQEAVRRSGVIGQREAARAGEEVLAAGGNAVDAAVTAAMVAAVVSIHQCGIGGYGGHMVIAPKGKKVTAIDYNSAAPAAARPDMFPLDDKGNVRDRINEIGWLAAGVPGTLAGLQLALDRYGTKSFREVVQPAIRYAKGGFPVSRASAGRLRTLRSGLAKDPATAKLLVPNGQPLKEGMTYRNPDLAALLQSLAEQGSVASFYKGDIARRIAAAFQKSGGLVTVEDLANYQAREVEPLALEWNGHTIHTAPLTAGGLTVLEALAVLRELQWDKLPAKDPKALHTQIDALRRAWHDRLRLLGDPEKAKVPWQRPLSTQHIRKLAEQVAGAVKEGKPVPGESDGRKAGGTIHLSAADSQGTMVALTLTHGSSFGTMMTVDGLGLLLGHGMSRFDPRPDHPNSPGPGKRPLHNMCPTIVTQGGQPVLALGGAGGRMIPNAIFNVLALTVGRGLPLPEAIGAPRPHTDGAPLIQLEPKQFAADAAFLKKLGFRVESGGAALVSAVARDSETGRVQNASR